LKWLIALDVALYIGAIVLFFTGLGLLSAICLILAIVLSFILFGGNDTGSGSDFTTFLLIDSVFDLFD